MTLTKTSDKKGRPSIEAAILFYLTKAFGIGLSVLMPKC